MLEGYGLLAENKPGLFNSVGDFAGDVAGFGAELVTDPLSYFGLGALTKTGKEAAKSGKLAALANDAGMAAKTVSAPIEAGYAGIGSMFGKPLWTGDNAAQFAGKYLDPAAEAVKYGKYSPVRYLRGLFSSEAGDTYDPFIQKLHEYRYTPAKELLETKARQSTLGLMKQGRELGVLGDDDLMREAIDIAEGVQKSATMPTDNAFVSDFGLVPSPTVDTRQAAVEFGGALSGRGKKILSHEHNVGLETGEMEQYLARRMDEAVAAQRKAAGKTGKLPSHGKHFVTTHPSQIARSEILANLGTNTVDDLVSDATLRELADPDARAAHIMGTYFAKDGSALDLDQASKLSQWAAQQPMTEKGKFFTDPISASHTREMFSARAQAAAQTVHDGIAKKSFPVEPGVLPPDGAVPVTKLLKDSRLGWNEVDEAGNPVAGGIVYLAKKLGIEPEQVGNLYVDPDTYKSLTKYAKSFTVPESIEPFLGAIDGLQNLSKTYLTQVFPAYHFRNLIGGMFQNFTDDAGYLGTKGTRDYLSPVQDAMRILKGDAIPGADAKFYKGLFKGDDAAATKRLAEEMFETRAAGPSGFDVVRSTLAGSDAPTIDQLGRVLPGEPGWVPNPSIRQTLKESIPKNREEWNPLNVRGWKGDLSKPTEFAPVKAGEKWTNKVEFLNRASHYLAKRSDGFDPMAAAAKTRQVHFDYGKMSKFERSVARRSALFYGFSRANLPYQVEAILKNPKKMSATIRAIGAGREDQGFAPGYIRETASIPLGSTPDGMQSYITGFGLPIEDAFNRFKFGPDGLKRSLQSQATMLRPELRLPLEWLAGEQMMTGRPLDRVDPLMGRIATNTIESLGGPSDINPRFLPPVVEQIASSSPVSRALGTVRQVVDPRKHNLSGLGRLGLNLGTGVRTEDVEPEQIRAEAMESLLKSLTGEQSVGVRRIPYLRKDRDPSQSVLERFAAYKAEAERAKQLRESGPGIRSRP